MPRPRLAVALALTLVVLTGIAGALHAQGTAISFGGLRADTSQPVEVTADSLTVDQGTGTAVFSGNVIVSQGAMRLSAQTLRVEYATGDQSRIERLVASGGVTLAAGADAAEAREATYEVARGTVELVGDVLLTQGQSTIAGQRLVVDLATGTGRMEGRVRTILVPGGQ
ncbi:lipopolysaccharide export system protein LptA [Albidovulum inexpectatum]|uniref:Lipopolysaccharide export system protein LptA n=1 Tax=Albidovulum inexpectatum TaxID=196587 RepID=A0A2S5JM32_9RHOB|nr:lipopolysaccharide export system protein LptA [Albidovulum inexpectatum]